MEIAWIKNANEFAFEIMELVHLARVSAYNKQILLWLQLDHRILATATLISIGALWWSTRKLDIHPAIRSLIGNTAGMASLQVCMFSPRLPFMLV